MDRAQRPNAEEIRGIFAEQDQEHIFRFWDELDAVVDDFLNKRLGGGEIYYGARESKFYGEEDRTRSKQEFGKYQGKGYSDSRRIAEKLGRDEGPKWVGDQLKEGSYLDGTGKAQRQANRFANLFDKKKE